MKIVFLLVLSTVLVGLVSTGPDRKESRLEALLNKIEEREQAKAESFAASQLANEALLKLMKIINMVDETVGAQTRRPRWVCDCPTSAPCFCGSEVFPEKIYRGLYTEDEEGVTKS